MSEDNQENKIQSIYDLRCRHSGLFGVSAIARHHQLNLDMVQLLHDHAVGVDELSMRELRGIAESHGLKSKEVKIKWSKFPSYAAVFPCILEKRDGHYAILCALRQTTPGEAQAACEASESCAEGCGAETPAEDGNEEQAEESKAAEAGKGKASDGKLTYDLVLVDPVYQRDHPGEQFNFISESEYKELYTGRALLLKRVYSLGDEDQPFGLRWFIPEFLKLKGVFFQIALAVLLLTLIALATPLFFQNVVDKVLVHESFSTLNVLGAGIVVAILFNAILDYLRGHLLLFATNKIDISTAVKTFAHMIRLPIEFFEQVPSGVLLKHMQQTEKIRGFLSGNLFFTILDMFSLLIFIPFLLLYSVKLTCVVLCFTLLMAFVIALLIKPFQRRLNALYQAEGQRQSRLVEAIHGIRTVKSLALEPLEEKGWGNRSAAAIKAYFSVGRISLTARSLSQALEMLMTISIIWLGALMVFKGSLSIGALIAFQMLAGRVTGPLVKMVGLIHEYQQIALSVRMLGAVMNTPVEPNMGRVRQPLKGKITFENVSFRYRPELPLVIKDFNLEMPAGGTLGIVGRSGSGKTTLTKLLQGLYPPFSGLVKIDGVDIREYEKSHLRSRIGVVLQENYFFSGTVRENISLTKPSATSEEIIYASSLAGAHEFVEKLPQGYDTFLEENASNLSGGQKQRLAIARALLTNPSILIFDEATSSLDPESEAVIQKNLAAITRGRTVIVVSHRLSMVVGAQRILVLDEGQRVAFGTHNELVNTPGIYRQFWQQQMGGGSNG
ncbi:MAG: peptidase domain-containing ABC transporter [Lentisphaerae bacterium]|jgi:subfamily B ATP-binding cassette protein HlyB/CyaB|nr:peptidase domain-containing ABC transporter [Lentisphaerota bacterium]